MTEFWEASFRDNQAMWGAEATKSAVFVRDYFQKNNINEVLIPGIGYGRNARPFLESEMRVTGIEISQTAIGIARREMNLDIPIYHGSVTDMPFDENLYDGIFCYGLLYLLNTRERKKLIQDCFNQLRPGGYMVFTVISKKAPMYGTGTFLEKDRYEIREGVNMFFYDTESVIHEFAPYGITEIIEIDEPNKGKNSSFPFINVICKKL